MRSMVIVLVVGLFGCKEHGKGGGIPNDDGGIVIIDAPTGELVDELTTNAQIALCNDFIDQVCANSSDPTVATFCANTCVADSSGGSGHSACVTASEGLDIDSECAGISVSAVEDCFTSGTLAVCGQGGGCMFDALEAVCPP